VEDLVLNYTLKRSEFIRGNLQALRLGVDLMLIFVVFAGSLLAQQWWGWVMLAIMVAWTSFRGVLQPLRVWKTNAAVREPRRVVINDDEITVTSPSRVVRIQWSTIRRTRETASFLLLVVERKRTGLALPKRVLGSNDVESNFREIVGRHVGTASKYVSTIPSLHSIAPPTAPQGAPQGMFSASQHQRQISILHSEIVDIGPQT
jgi:hypothetical protein